MNHITREELTSMFGDHLPLVAVKLIFPEKSDPLTSDELRTVLAALAANPRPPAPALGPDPNEYEWNARYDAAWPVGGAGMTEETDKAPPKYTARGKLFADGAKGYKLQVYAVMADGKDIGIDLQAKCENGVWSKVFACEEGEFPTLAEALKAKEARARDDERDAAAPTEEPG